MALGTIPRSANPIWPPDIWADVSQWAKESMVFQKNCTTKRERGGWLMHLYKYHLPLELESSSRKTCQNTSMWLSCSEIWRVSLHKWLVFYIRKLVGRVRKLFLSFILTKATRCSHVLSFPQCAFCQPQFGHMPGWYHCIHPWQISPHPEIRDTSTTRPNLPRILGPILRRKSQRSAPGYHWTEPRRGYGGNRLWGNVRWLSLEMSDAKLNSLSIFIPSLVQLEVPGLLLVVHLQQIQLRHGLVAHCHARVVKSQKNTEICDRVSSA